MMPAYKLIPSFSISTQGQKSSQRKFKDIDHILAWYHLLPTG